MKKNNYKFILVAVLFSIMATTVIAQDGDKKDLMLSVSYFNNNNKTQYLVAHTKCKIDGKFLPIPAIEISFYITNDSSESHFLGKSITNDKGEAPLMIPATAQSEWTKSTKQSFVVVSKATKVFDQTKASSDIVKAKLKIDTTSDRKINVTFLELKDTSWTIVKGVELKVAIKRLGGDLNVSETQTYTTDSTGAISADFKRDSLPGDLNGNLTLIAKVEDNDTYGNLTVEEQVPWGNKFEYVSRFDRRTLFARRGHSPIWLELLAYSIIVVVWIILIYLIGQLRKIKMLGEQAPPFSIASKP